MRSWLKPRPDLTLQGIWGVSNWPFGVIQSMIGLFIPLVSSALAPLALFWIYSQSMLNVDIRRFINLTRSAMSITSSSEDDMSRSSKLGTSRRSSRKTACSFRSLQLCSEEIVQIHKIRTRWLKSPLDRHRSWLEGHSRGASGRCRRHGQPSQSGARGAPRGPEKSYTIS